MAFDHLPWPASADALARDCDMFFESGSGPFALVTLGIDGANRPYEFTHRFLTREAREQFTVAALRNGITIVREFEEGQ